MGVGEDTELLARGWRPGGCCAIACVEIGEPHELVVMGEPAAMRRLAEFVLRAVDNAERIINVADRPCCAGGEG